MSNAIYIINDLPEDADFANPGYKDMAWVPHCLGSIQKYAARIGAELISVNMDSFPAYRDSINNYDFSHYQKSVFLKILILHDFIKRGLNKFALLDLDMVINKSAPDIFEVHKDEDFVMQYGFNEAVVAKNEIFLKQYLKVIKPSEEVYRINEANGRKIPKYNLNLGCYIMSNKIVSRMTKALPDQNCFVDFLDHHNLLDNPLIEVFGEKKDFIDQDLYAYAYATTDVLKYHKPLKWEWNANYQACFQKGEKNKDFYLCHLCGEDGKQFLLDNLDNPEVMNKIDV